MSEAWVPHIVIRDEDYQRLFEYVAAVSPIARGDEVVFNNATYKVRRRRFYVDRNGTISYVEVVVR